MKSPYGSSGFRNPLELVRERGIYSLKNHELLSLILGKSRKADVFELSRQITEHYRCLTVLDNADVDEIMDVFGLSESQAIKVLAIFELGRRFYSGERGIFIRSPEEAYEYLKNMVFLKKEHLRGLYLDARNKVIRDEIVAIGTLTSSLIHPREVFRPAVEVGAVGIILAHNHPSGDPSPSREDIEATQNLVNASKIMHIDILDHIIVGNNSYSSMKEKGIIN